MSRLKTGVPPLALCPPSQSERVQDFGVGCEGGEQPKLRDCARARLEDTVLSSSDRLLKHILRLHSFHKNLPVQWVSDLDFHNLEYFL